ncbi:MAG: tyrosine-type recombinase/integrase [Phycisphaerales bacterium]
MATAPKRRRPRRYPPEVLTDAEVRLLMDACGEGPRGDRNRALLALMYRTGLRVSEALALSPKDVDLHAGTVRVLNGKGGKTRVVGIDPGGAAVVATWAAVREALRVGASAPLFCALPGGTEAIKSGYARNMLKRIARRAGIAKRVHAHGLRHTHASQLREEGVDIGIISRQLGHASIDTTARYLDHIAPTAVIRVMRERAW